MSPAASSISPGDASPNDVFRHDLAQHVLDREPQGRSVVDRHSRQNPKLTLAADPKNRMSAPIEPAYGPTAMLRASYPNPDIAGVTGTLDRNRKAQS